jgi:hypothetical protein
MATNTRSDGRTIQWFGDDGVVYNIKMCDGQPRVIAQSYETQIAEGNLTGHTPWTKIWEARLGANKGVTGIASNINYPLEVKSNTKYVWRITKNAAGTHFVDADFFFSEINPNAI